MPRPTVPECPALRGIPRNSFVRDEPFLHERFIKFWGLLPSATHTTGSDGAYGRDVHSVGMERAR
jgi:hypothetical protein